MTDDRLQMTEDRSQMTERYNQTVGRASVPSSSGTCFERSGREKHADLSRNYFSLFFPTSEFIYIPVAAGQAKGSRARGNGPCQAKADIAAAVVGPVAVANRRPAVVRNAGPAAAADHAGSAPGIIHPGTPITGAWRRWFEPAEPAEG